MGCNKAFPDQIIQFKLVRGQVRLNLAWSVKNRCGAYGFMGILSLIFIFEKTGFLQGIFGTEFLSNQSQCIMGSFCCNTGGVCTHVGDQTFRAIGTYIYTLVELLGNKHGLFSRKFQPVDGILLEFTGNKGRERVALDGFDRYTIHNKLGLHQLLHNI